ncbi:MAG: HAMP domain-containing sensor histidine kinase [Bacteroidota bacterium]
MTKRSYRNSLILIIVTAVMLISVQVYYTIQNYQVNKLHFIHDVQESLDTSIEKYFANKAKNNIYILTSTTSDTIINGKKPIGITTQVKSVDSLLRSYSDSVTSIRASGFTHIWSSDSLELDSAFSEMHRPGFAKLKFSQTFDSGSIQDFQFLTQKVMVSLSEELIDIGALYTILNEELTSKEFDIEFKIRQEIEGRNIAVGEISFANYLTREASSSYLGDFHSIFIDFENATLIILKDGISELILSVLLVGLVIGTLIHLYRTIYAQKQLAAIKDDLISNITHEFKTPIATIFSALEGVTSFNETNDPEKTKRYLALSNSQLHKLNDMVEKMLETATIDQGQLTLNKEELEAVAWTAGIVEHFQLVEHAKEIQFETELTSRITGIDRFHLENAISNIVDNAIKYGGDKIVIRLKAGEDTVVWEVEDNGGNISKHHREKIFEKLYRIPTGNTHDVKGFGIGLYYARTIAELHEGQLTLESSDSKTLFRMTI